VNRRRLAQRAEYMDVFCNPVSLGVYTIQWLAGYPLARIWHDFCSGISCLFAVQYHV